MKGTKRIIEAQTPFNNVEDRENFQWPIAINPHDLISPFNNCPNGWKIYSNLLIILPCIYYSSSTYSKNLFFSMFYLYNSIFRWFECDSILKYMSKFMLEESESVNSLFLLFVYFKKKKKDNHAHLFKYYSIHIYNIILYNKISSVDSANLI